MSIAHETPDFLDDLADLQADSLKVIALVAGVAAYVPFLLWPVISESVGISFWIGAGLLGLSSIISYVLKGRHLRIARHALVWGILGAIGCVVLAFQSPMFAYLLILPVIFASTLLSQRAVFLVAAMAGFLTLTASLTRAETPLPPVEVMLPLAFIALTTLASRLSVRNLHTALTWVWSGYERARRNEEIARDRAGELRRVLKALDEATHRLERANHMLALARDQAEEARRLKQQFAQTVSHELRTPLNLIVGFTELMTESPEYYGGQLPPAYQRDLNIVHRNARHLQNMVNDVLDLARIDAAQMSILLEEVSPAAITQQAVDTARSLVEARGLALHAEIEPDLPQLWADPTRIRQVLINLLNNAARFTDEGSVTVSVRREEESVIFAVRDTGVGIAPEDIPHIFEEFRQADGSTRRRHGGVGLGLAISQRFVELHGGRMWVESQVGQGSTFSFSLPLAKTDLTSAPGGSPAEVIHTGSGRGSEAPVLLAVARSPAAATLLTHYMHDLRTVAVPDLEQAQKAARTVLPQVVLVDQACEKLDLARLERIAREWELPRVPFIACPLLSEERLGQHLAVDGYLVKPVSRRSLWDVLRRFGKDVDTVLVVDDDLDFVRLMSRMLEDNPVRRYRVIGAYGGKEGLDMMHLHRPDLVLLDLGLPDMDGFQVVERIRSTPEWRHIPIVIVSARDSVDDQKPLMGAMMVTKSEGLMPGEVMRWARTVIETAVMSPPAPVGPKAESVS